MPAPAGTQSIERTLNILSFVAAADNDGVKLRDVAEKLGLTQPTAARILKALEGRGFVERDCKGKAYHLGMAFFTLATGASNRNGLKAVARPILLSLAQETGESIFLLVRSGLDAVCVDRQDGQVPIRTITGAIGGRVPLGVGPGSQAILATLPDAESKAVIAANGERYRAFPRFRADGLDDALAATKRLGFAHDTGSLIPGIHGLGVAIIDKYRCPMAALGLGGIGPRLTSERIPSLVEALARAAERIADRVNPLDPTLIQPDDDHLGPDPHIME